jgi:hypothetical protein
MVDFYLVANPLVFSSLPSHTAMTDLHNTLESINDIHLPNPCIIIPPPPLFNTYSPHSSCIYHLPPNPTQPNTYLILERTSLTYSPTRGALAWDLQDFVYTDGSKKGAPPLGGAATHPASNARVEIQVTSTPLPHTINRAELAGIDVGI